MKQIRKYLEKKYKYFNLIGHGVSFPGRKFLIYTRGRTGSTLLTELLNCHPDIFCDVEIFNFIYSGSRVMFPMRYIDACSKRATLRGKGIYGFKVKISQLLFEHKYKNYQRLLDELSSKNWKFIYLKRRNFIRHKISNFITTKTNVFHIRKEDIYRHPKIHVDCKELMRGVVYSEEVEKTEEMNLKNIPHITLVYEDDLLDNSKLQKTADAAFEFLGVHSVQVKTEYIRATGERLEDVVENYDEVFNYFKNTKYSHMLE